MTKVTLTYISSIASIHAILASQARRAHGARDAVDTRKTRHPHFPTITLQTSGTLKARLSSVSFWARQTFHAGMTSLALWALHPSCTRWAPVPLLCNASSRTGTAAARLVPTSPTVSSSSRVGSLSPTSSSDLPVPVPPLRVAASKGSEGVKTHIKVVGSKSYISTLHSKSVLQRETDVKWRQTVNGLCQFGPVTGNLSGSHSDASIHSLLHPIHFKNGSSLQKNYIWTSLTFVRVSI